MNLKKLTAPILTITLITSLIVGWFYWFEWRPAEIRKSCFLEASETLKADILNKGSNLSDEAKENLKKNLESLDNNRLFALEDFNEYYQACLLAHGIKSESIVLEKKSQKQDTPEVQIPNRDSAEDTSSYTPPVQVIQDSTPKEEKESWVEIFERERKQKCQEDINDYNICMNEYNAKMAEYNECMTEAADPTSLKSQAYGRYATITCIKPSNFCYKPLSCN